MSYRINFDALPKRVSIDPFAVFTDRILDKVYKCGVCRIEAFGELKGVVWLSPRGVVHSWWMPLEL